MSSKRLCLIAGLGNPGAEYGKTRHNAGFLALDKIAAAFSIVFDKTKFDLRFGRGRIDGLDVVLAKPQAFMNRSGQPLQQLVHFFKISLKDILIIHDDIDLTIGRIKIKTKGGHGGHKGVKSIIDAFGSGEFGRIRIGVGRSEQLSVTHHVLGRFNTEEEKVLDQMLTVTRNAAVSFFLDGSKACMNEFNRKINEQMKINN
jgi:PTH1 family peptidyl-tRNA hydrolase